MSDELRRWLDQLGLAQHAELSRRHDPEDLRELLMPALLLHGRVELSRNRRLPSP